MGELMSTCSECGCDVRGCACPVAVPDGLERQGLYIAGSGGHQYADFAPSPNGHLVRWSDAAARIRELEAERDALRATIERVRGLKQSAAIGFASETVRWSDVAAALGPLHSG